MRQSWRRQWWFMPKGHMDDWTTYEADAFWSWLNDRWRLKDMLRSGPSQEWLDWLVLCYLRGDSQDGRPPREFIRLQAPAQPAAPRAIETWYPRGVVPHG